MLLSCLIVELASWLKVVPIWFKLLDGSNHLIVLLFPIDLCLKQVAKSYWLISSWILKASFQRTILILARPKGSNGYSWVYIRSFSLCFLSFQGTWRPDADRRCSEALSLCAPQAFGWGREGQTPGWRGWNSASPDAPRICAWITCFLCIWP